MFCFKYDVLLAYNTTIYTVIIGVLRIIPQQKVKQPLFFKKQANPCKFYCVVIKVQKKVLNTLANTIFRYNLSTSIHIYEANDDFTTGCDAFFVYKLALRHAGGQTNCTAKAPLYFAKLFGVRLVRPLH